MALRIILIAAVVALTCEAAMAQTVHLAPLPKGTVLPQTNAYKLVGNPKSYVRRVCDYPGSAMCQVFVQPDRSGSLLGYIALRRTRDGGILYESDTVTRDGRQCLLVGRLEGSAHSDPDPAHFDLTRDFKKVSYFSTEQGNGAFYFERVGNRLRINDERWNYCYTDEHIDDVWYLMGTEAH